MSQDAQDNNQKNDDDLLTALKQKTKYLTQLQTALTKHDDLRVYKLLDTTKYYRVMEQKRYGSEYEYKALYADLLPQLRHHLSYQLIKYLKKAYPFFYYHEDKLGHYQIYFGDWWGHKLFGTLDVINVKFDFDKVEYNKLRRVCDNKHQGVDSQNIKMIKEQNDRLIKLIKTQTKRDNSEAELKSDLKENESQARMPWNSARIKDNYSKITHKLKSLEKSDKKARNAKALIRKNQQKTLEYSKENTVVDYERNCIKKYFGDLSQFNENNKQLYYNYISHLVAGGKN